MTFAYESPGFGAAESASLSPPEVGYLSTRETNVVQAALEQRAEDEANDLSPEFLDWLANDDGFAALRSRYVAERVNTFNLDERAEIEREALGG